MSLPVTMYYCTVCDFEQGNAGTWGTREYVLDSLVRIPVRSYLGWCESCNGLAAIENLSIQERIRAYRITRFNLEQEVQRSGKGWLFGLSKSELSLQRMYKDNMEDAIDAIEMLASRKSLPHCLNCLSTQVHIRKKRSIDNGNTPVIFNQHNEPAAENNAIDSTDQSKAEVLLHPGCGGEIRAREFDMQNGMSIALRPSIHRYTTECNYIEKEYVDGYSAQEREYRDKLSESNSKYRTLAMKKEFGDGTHISAFLRKQAD